MLRAVATLIVCAFQQPAPGQDQYRLVSEVRLVLLDVGVRDRQSRPVAGLQRQHFRIYDNGEIREITSFAREDLPVSIVLVMDTSRSMARRWHDAVNAALSMVRASHREDEVALIAFADHAVLRLPFTTDHAALREALLREFMAGRTALHDALALALQQFRHANRQRYAIVLISDGGDNASATGERDLIQRLRQSQATLFAVELFDENSRERDSGLLRQLAAISGGEFLQPRTGLQLEDAFRHIAEEMRGRYLIGFRAAETPRQQVRRIRVEVSAPDGARLRVRARGSYVAEPPASPGAGPSGGQP